MRSAHLRAQQAVIAQREHDLARRRIRERLEERQTRRERVVRNERGRRRACRRDVRALPCSTRNVSVRSDSSPDAVRAPVQRRAIRGSAPSSQARPSLRHRTRRTAPAVRSHTTCVAASSRPRAERVLERADRGVRRVAASADAPVAGGRVVHGIVELGRRDQRRRVCERRAHVVADRRDRHGWMRTRSGSSRGRATGRFARARRDFECDRDRVGRTPALGRREQGSARVASPPLPALPARRGSPRARSSQPGSRVDQNATPSIATGGSAALIAGRPGRTPARNCCRRSRTRSSARAARAAARCRSGSAGRRPDRASAVLSVPGSKPCSSASRLIAASTMPAAPSV